jgi:hypothetical protein
MEPTWVCDALRAPVEEMPVLGTPQDRKRNSAVESMRRCDPEQWAEYDRGQYYLIADGQDGYVKREHAWIRLL